MIDNQPKVEDGRAWWMSGKWGIAVWWLLPGPPREKGEYVTDPNQAAREFDLDRFMAEFDRTGADWLLFAFGLHTPYFTGPNKVLDEMAGKGHCIERDLMGEIAQAVKSRGKRFIAYITSGPTDSPEIQKALGWEVEGGHPEYQRRYLQVLREWGERYGTLIDAWWIDGVYAWSWNDSHKFDWPAWYDALRAGNPDRALTFNDGSFCDGKITPIRPEHDYLSGECDALLDGKIRLGRMPDATILPARRYAGVGKTQWHVLLPLDGFWAHGNWSEEDQREFTAAGNVGLPYETRSKNMEDSGPMERPAYSDEELFEFVKHCVSVGGGVTLNPGIYQEGHMGADTVAQLERLSKVVPNKREV